MSVKKMYLVIRADQQVRVVSRPQLRVDEVAIPIHLSFPQHWGRYLKDPIEINVPDFTPEVRYELGETSS